MAQSNGISGYGYPSAESSGRPEDGDDRADHQPEGNDDHDGSLCDLCRRPLAVDTDRDRSRDQQNDHGDKPRERQRGEGAPNAVIDPNELQLLDPDVGGATVHLRVFLPQVALEVGALEAGGARRARQATLGVRSGAPLGGSNRLGGRAVMIECPQQRSPGHSAAPGRPAPREAPYARRPVLCAAHADPQPVCQRRSDRLAPQAVRDTGGRQ